jgi:hypothetical protein
MLPMYRINFFFPSLSVNLPKGNCKTFGTTFKAAANRPRSTASAPKFIAKSVRKGPDSPTARAKRDALTKMGRKKEVLI